MTVSKDSHLEPQVKHNLTSWLPPTGLDITLLPVGRWWDAVRVPVSIGESAFRLLAGDTGAVIKDPYSARLYWLVRPETATDWTIPRVTVLSAGSYIGVPAWHRVHAPGLRWLAAPDRGRHLTDPVRLHAALEAALALNPAPEAAR
ncbi:hypothetical protein ACZ90_08330 [Streptomyces albus subsp. albus]|nr:hypothetical protein ACZ90_08330 [Streptomyces albus subsp. albus]